MVEPPNPLSDNPCAPTVTKRDGGNDFIKHDFVEEEFDIPLSKATDKKVKRGRDGCVIFHNEGGKGLLVYEYIPCTMYVPMVSLI